MRKQTKRTGVAPGRGRKTLVSLAVLVALACAITLPFLNKAFHLDDTVFIRLGEAKLEDPLSVGLEDHGYEGRLFDEYLDTHPPLVASYLALLIKAFDGAPEAGLHLGFLVFVVIACISMYFLSRRFTDSPLAASMLLMVTPGFMVMAQSVMSDVPALAFWLASIAAYIEGVDREDGRLLALSGVALVLAVMTAYQSLSLLPLLLFYAIIKRRVSVGNLAPLAAGLLVFAAFVVFFYQATGGPPKLSYSIGIITDPAFIAKKVLSIVSVLGGGIIFPAFIVAGMLKGKRDYLAFAGLVALLSLSILLQVVAGEYTPLPAILQVIFYAAGILAFYRYLKVGSDAAFARDRTSADTDSIFLLTWIVGVLFYSVALLPYASTRYLLPLFPPAVLMFIRYARKVIARDDAWKRFAAGAVALTAAAGLAVAIADYQLSGVYRSFAASNGRELSGGGGGRVWVAGEFGLRYYLELEGAAYITQEGPQPAPGDHVVMSHKAIASFISEGLREHLRLERETDYPVNWPVRVQDRDSLAGFYAQFHGYLPYSFADGPIESIAVYAVE